MISPYPWHAIPRAAVGEVAAMRALRHALPWASARGVASAISELVGHSAIVELRRRALIPLARLDVGARGPTTVLSIGEGALALAIEIEAELALAVVGALAGGKTLPRIARGRRVEPLVAGALAGVVQHVARAMQLDDATLVAIDASAADVRAALASGGEDVVMLELSVRLGALRTNARVAAAVPKLAQAAAKDRRTARELLVDVGVAPMTLEAVIAAGFAPARELSLDLGDVLVVDGLQRGDACVLAAADDAFGVEATLLRDEARARVRVGTRRVELAPEPTLFEKGEQGGKGEKDGPMAEATNPTGATMEIPAMDASSPLAEALAEMPILVRVEVGSATLTAREWASIGTGDVVVLDRRVGEPVLLRIGGKVVGRGELVEVDGALGVRLVERAP